MIPRGPSSSTGNQTKLNTETEISINEEMQDLREQNAVLKRLLLKTWKAQGSAEFNELPTSLQDDREFVLSMVESCPIDWVDLPEQWKDDAEVACATFRRLKIQVPNIPNPEHGDEDELCRMLAEPPLRWSDLPYHLQTNEKVVHRALQSRYGPRWEQIHHKLRSNEELLSTALRFGHISFDLIPEHLKRTHQKIAFHGVQLGLLEAEECPCLEPEFLERMVKAREISWARLPPSLRDDVDLARSIPLSSDSNLVIEILGHFDQIRHDQSYWRQILDSNMEDDDRTSIIMEFLPLPNCSDKSLMIDICSVCTEALELVPNEILLDRNFWIELVKSNTEEDSNRRRDLMGYIPPTFLSDKRFMIDICIICTVAFDLIANEDLGSDRDFLEAVLAQNASVLKILPHNTQQRHRDLVLRTLPRFALTDDPMDIIYLARQIRPVFWFQRDFAFAWAKSGLGWPRHAKRNVRGTWRKIRDLCLEVAISSKSLAWADKFTDDLPFMLRVLDKHPDLYPQAHGLVKADLWAMALAFAGCPQVAKDALMELHIEGKDDVIESFLLFLRDRLEPYDNFRTLILGSMLSTQSVEQTGTALTLLNQGPETSAMYKKEIAAYLGIETGMELCRLQQAEQNSLQVVAIWAHPAT
jgi:hypothetical protein